MSKKRDTEVISLRPSWSIGEKWERYLGLLRYGGKLEGSARVVGLPWSEVSEQIELGVGEVCESILGAESYGEQRLVTILMDMSEGVGREKLEAIKFLLTHRYKWGISTKGQAETELGRVVTLSRE